MTTSCGNFGHLGGDGPDLRGPSAYAEEHVRNAIARLRGLRDGDRAVVDLVTCGPVAIRPLRDLLFAREPAGIFLPRCLAAEALADLGAKDILCEFLASPRTVDDPVEQTGEDAVTNAVARALKRWPDERVYALLLAAAKRKLLAGVVETIGSYRRPEGIPILAAALAEDACRSVAEKAFRLIGATACRCLMDLAVGRLPSPETESESSRRRRRSALKLVAELDCGNEVPEVLNALMADADPWIAEIACSIGLSRLGDERHAAIAWRLVELLDGTDPFLSAEIEDVLTHHYVTCRIVVDTRVGNVSGSAARSLRRVLLRAVGPYALGRCTTPLTSACQAFPPAPST